MRLIRSLLPMGPDAAQRPGEPLVACSAGDSDVADRRVGVVPDVDRNVAALTVKVPHSGDRHGSGLTGRALFYGPKARSRFSITLPRLGSPYRRLSGHRVARGLTRLPDSQRERGKRGQTDEGVDDDIRPVRRCVRGERASRESVHRLVLSRTNRVTPHPSAIGRLPESPLGKNCALCVSDDSCLNLENAIGELHPRQHRIGRRHVVVRATARDLGKRVRRPQGPPVTTSTGHQRVRGASVRRVTISRATSTCCKRPCHAV